MGNEWRRVIRPGATFDDVLMALVELPPEISREHGVANLVFCGNHKASAVEVIHGIMGALASGEVAGLRVVTGFVSPAIMERVEESPDGSLDCSEAVLEDLGGEFEYHFSAVESGEA